MWNILKIKVFNKFGIFKIFHNAYFGYTDFQQLFNNSIFWIFAISPCAIAYLKMINMINIEGLVYT